MSAARQITPFMLSNLLLLGRSVKMIHLSSCEKAGAESEVSAKKVKNTIQNIDEFARRKREGWRKSCHCIEPATHFLEEMVLMSYR